jgi:hypothetical protein
MDRTRSQSLQDIQRMKIHSSSTPKHSAKFDVLSDLNLDNHQHRRNSSSQVTKQSFYRSLEDEGYSKRVYDSYQKNPHFASSKTLKERSEFTAPIKLEAKKRLASRNKPISQGDTINNNVHDGSNKIDVTQNMKNQQNSEKFYFDLCLPTAHNQKTPISDISSDELDWMEDLYNQSISHIADKAMSKGEASSIKQLGSDNNISAAMEYVLESSSRHRSCLSPQIKRASSVINKNDGRQSSMPRKSPEVSYLRKSVSDYLVSPEWQRHEKLLLDWRTFVNSHMLRSPKITCSPHDPQSLHSVGQEDTFSEMYSHGFKDKVPSTTISDHKQSLTKKRRDKKKFNESFRSRKK